MATATDSGEGDAVSFSRGGGEPSAHSPPTARVDGVFGMQTWHAVIAFQGWSSLACDGVAGPRTHAALAHARRPSPWSRTTGFEVHIATQVLLLVRNGHVDRAIHVSTGANVSTPAGHYRIYRREAMSWSVQFRVWMPLAQYFHRGYAMHAFATVPSYPASHGCVRIPQSQATTARQFGRVACASGRVPDARAVARQIERRVSASAIS